MWFPRGRGVGKGWTGNLGLAEQTIIYKMDKQQGPIILYITGTYSQYPVTNKNGKEYEKEHIPMYN